MERIPYQQQGGGQPPEGDLYGTDDPLLPAAVAEAEPLSHDEHLIQDGITQAIAENRNIDDRTARYIASQLHGGQASGLYAFASTGAIPEVVHDELDRDFDQQPRDVQQWITWLQSYCQDRADLGPVDGWVESAAALDQAEEEATARNELMNRISAAGVTTLGEVAVVQTAELAPAGDHEPVAALEDDDRDPFSWGDAARWSPEQTGEDQPEFGLLTDDQLDALFTVEPDEEVGDADELGWYALVRSEGQPGGCVICVDRFGTRTVLEVVTDDGLQEAWDSVTTTYERYYEERDAYERATEEPDTRSGIQPRIWVGSLADYTNGRLFGEWFDATLEAEELHAATRFLLRLSPMPGAEEHGIFDYEGFGALRLDEYESLETVSRIAQGIAEHGEAFAAWASAVGTDDPEALDRFEDHFRGEWESFAAYVQDLLEETSFYDFLEYVAEDMRGYVTVDVEQIARDWGTAYEVVERDGGGMWVFDLAN